MEYWNLLELYTANIYVKVMVYGPMGGFFTVTEAVNGSDDSYGES